MSRRIITGTVPTERGDKEDQGEASPVTGSQTQQTTRGSEAPQAISNSRISTKATQATIPPLTPDDFLGRLVKYIPAELVGLYIASRGVIPKTAEPSVYWTVAAITWAFVPLYFWFVTTRNNQKPLRTQILLGTIAFPIWVFAIGGDPVVSWGWYTTHQYLASLVLMFATVAFGLVQPPPGA